MAWWSMIRMPGKSHQGPLPPADSALERLASELRSHVATLALAIRSALHAVPTRNSGTAGFVHGVVSLPGIGGSHAASRVG